MVVVEIWLFFEDFVFFVDIISGGCFFFFILSIIGFDSGVGVFVLDLMCGFGIIFLEVVKEWLDVYYVGVDVSNLQLLGIWDNLKVVGFEDKIELFKVFVIELLLFLESVDIIIFDILFGKKFKLGKDVKSIL